MSQTKRRFLCKLRRRWCHKNGDGCSKKGGRRRYDSAPTTNPHHVAFVLITAVRLDVKINKIISWRIMPHDSCLLASRVDEF